jgi:predicted RNase H-like HicB family nuclease
MYTGKNSIEYFTCQYIYSISFERNGKVLKRKPFRSRCLLGLTMPIARRTRFLGLQSPQKASPAMLNSSYGVHLMIFHVSLEKAEDGWIVAQCPALPGCVSQGRDEQEALENIKEAITAWLWAEDQKAVKALGSDRTPVVVTV